jgi:hypothetical protein
MHNLWVVVGAALVFAGLVVWAGLVLAGVV